MSEKPRLVVYSGGRAEEDELEPLRPRDCAYTIDPSFFEFTQRGKSVGRVQASFEFTDVPEEHHETILIQLGLARRKFEVPEIPDRRHPRVSLFELARSALGGFLRSLWWCPRGS